MKRITGWTAGAVAVALSLALALPDAGIAQDKNAGQQNQPAAQAGQAANQGQQNQARQRQQQQNQQQNQDQKQDQEEKPQKPEPRKLRVFELEHRSPQQIQQLISLHGQRPVHYGPGGVPGTTVGYRGVPQQNLSVAVDNEHKLVFLRGTEKQLGEVEELIDAFDVAEGDIKKQTFGDLHLIPVRGGMSNQVSSILGQLQLPAQLVQLGEVGLIVVRTGEEEEDHLQQVEEVISRVESAKSNKQADGSEGNPEQQKANQQKANQQNRQNAQGGQTGNQSSQQSGQSGQNNNSSNK